VDPGSTEIIGSDGTTRDVGLTVVNPSETSCGDANYIYLKTAQLETSGPAKFNARFPEEISGQKSAFEESDRGNQTPAF
jgi:hypothetical protein